LLEASISVRNAPVEIMFIFLLHTNIRRSAPGFSYP
jgi:hypothetical protein